MWFYKYNNYLILSLKRSNCKQNYFETNNDLYLRNNWYQKNNNSRVELLAAISKISFEDLEKTYGLLMVLKTLITIIPQNMTPYPTFYYTIYFWKTL